MTPTIFIPGITGNTIVNTNAVEFQLLYSAIGRYFKDMSRLSLQLDEQFDLDQDVISERSHIEKLAYKELDTFICEENEMALYIFNYDWRRSNGYNGKKLKEFVDYLKKKLYINVPAQPFNFLTHSMGSLVFRAYLKEVNGDDSDIKKAVLTVPPNKGAVEALKMLVLGKSYLINSADTFRKIARTFPSLYEMIPIYEGAFSATHDPNFDIFEPNCWQSNLYATETSAERKMLEERLAAAKLFVTTGMLDFSAASESLKNKILIIAGNNEETLELVNVKATSDKGPRVTNFFDFDTHPTKNGDGTVPRASVLYYQNIIQTVIVDSSIWHGNPIDKITGQHALFLTDGRVQTIAKRFFKGERTDKWWEVIGGSTYMA